MLTENMTSLVGEGKHFCPVIPHWDHTVLCGSRPRWEVGGQSDESQVSRLWDSGCHPGSFSGLTKLWDLQGKTRFDKWPPESGQDLGFFWKRQPSEESESLPSPSFEVQLHCHLRTGHLRFLFSSSLPPSGFLFFFSVFLSFLPP